MGLAAICGLLIGSFLNVVIWRVPRGESVVRPPSHCPRCARLIAARDNVPVLSWLLLRGRCRHCGEPISARYPGVELATGMIFAATAAAIGPHAELPAFLYLAAVSVALTMIDIDTRRLPNAIVLPSYAVALLGLGAAAVVQQDGSRLLRSVLGAAALFGFYFLLAFVYPAGMGFGDVKLAGVLGLYLGWLGWGSLFVGAFAAFLLGGVLGAALLAFGRAGRKTAIPFGPWMLAGAFVAVFAGQQLAEAYRRAMFG